MSTSSSSKILHQTILKFNEEEDKINQLVATIKTMGAEEKLLIICANMPQASHVASELAMCYINYVLLENKVERDLEEIEYFNDGKTNIMIIPEYFYMDVGLRDFTSIINYEFPASLKKYMEFLDYTRGQGNNYVTTYLCQNNSHSANSLIQKLRQMGQQLKIVKHPSSS